MNGERLTLVLDPLEMQALRNAARADLRRPRDQARHILRSALLMEFVTESIVGLPEHSDSTTAIVPAQ